MNGAAWSASLYGKLTALGYTGKDLDKFSMAYGNGSADYVTGKSFMTDDVGEVSGSGTGMGVGITGLSSGTITTNIYGLSVGYFGQAGKDLFDICNAMGETCVEQMALAMLSSTDSPVYEGTGTIVVGSIAVVGGPWGDMIQSDAPDFIGDQWPNFANAIGQGQAEEIVAAGTGTLTITGSGSGSGGGTGTGVGTIS